MTEGRADAVADPGEPKRRLAEAPPGIPCSTRAMLRVQALLGLSGEVRLEVDVQPEAKVLALKEEIASRLEVPVLFQVLILRALVLSDDEMLAVHHPGGSEVLLVTILVSFDLARRCIQGGSETEKTEVLRGLAQKGIMGDDRSIIAAEALEDRSKDVRETAVEILGIVGKEDSRGTVNAVVARLGSTLSAVRFSAAKALREVARRGDEDALRALLAHLEDESADVREVVMAAFGDIAERGSADAIATVLQHLHDRSMDVRWRALEALGKLVIHKGDEHIVNAVVRCLEMPNTFVRRWAVEVLSQVSEKGNRSAIAAVTAHMDHPDDYVRMAAGVALSGIAERGDEFALSRLAVFMGHQDPGVRLAAIVARRALRS